MTDATTYQKIRKREVTKHYLRWLGLSYFSQDLCLEAWLAEESRKVIFACQDACHQMPKDTQRCSQIAANAPSADPATSDALKVLWLDNYCFTRHDTCPHHVMKWKGGGGFEPHDKHHAEMLSKQTSFIFFDGCIARVVLVVSPGEKKKEDFLMNRS